MKKQNKNPETAQLRFPGWLFLAAMGVYLELLLHLWTLESLSWGRLTAVAVFALAFGALLGFAASFLPKKAEKWVTVTLSLVLTVIYLVEYFINDAYMCFMPPVSIVNSAGGVMSDFSSMVWGAVLQDLWRIVLVLAPTVLYGCFAQPCGRRRKIRMILAVLFVCLYLLGFGLVSGIGTDVAKLSATYDFDSAVRSFGLNVSLILELANGTRQEGEDSFLTPTETTQPTETTEVTEATEETTEEPTQETTEETTEAPTEPPVVYGDNALDIDYAALAAESGSKIASIHSYVASLTPSKQNEFTGLFEGKNLILITAEAFAAEVIDPELTPTLYRLATEGIQFTDYYQPAWGGSTSTGEFSILTGLYPANGTSSIKESIQQDMFLTIGNQLQDKGYTSYAFHNHSYTYYDRHKTHVAMGYDRFIGYGNGMEKGVKKQWPESDLEMMEYTVDLYLDQQPFSIYYMTVSGHCNYSTDGNLMCRKNIGAVSHLDCSDTVKAYLACQMELEYGLTVLLQRLEEAGILDDTVIVLSTDHYPYGLEKSSTWDNNRDYLSELYGYSAKGNVAQDHSALIIWSGCIEDMDLVVDTPTYSLDILPTLSNLFGVPYDSRLLIGRDVFSEEQPLVIWKDYSWKTELGYYDAGSGTFTPAEGVEVTEDYVAYISAIVTNKVNFSKMVQNNDYYDYLIPYLGG